MIRKISQFLLLLLFIGFGLFKTKNLISMVQNNYQSVKKEPQNETYTTDEKRYLKTYYLMKKGDNYYTAHYNAFQAVAGGEENVWKKDAWGWRLPTIFYFWKLLTKNGANIINLFVIMVFFTMLSLYLIAKKFTNKHIALLAPLMILPYFLNAIKTTSFLFTTWWGAFFLIIGLAFFYYQKHFWACLFFCLAICTRELLVIPLLAMLIISFWFKRNRLVFLVPIGLLGFYLLYHNHRVSQLLILESSFEIINRLSSFNKETLLTTLAFSTNSYLLLFLRPALIWITTSCFGLGYLLFKNKNKYSILIAFASFLAFFLALGFIGQSRWEDYWGPLYVPMMAAFSPILIITLNEDHKKN